MGSRPAVAERRRAVFLDRDGTLNEEVDYLASPEDFRLLPGVVDGLGELAGAGFALVVVTNQSGIARGILDEDTLRRIHETMRAELRAAGLEIDAVHACPHHPEIGAPYFRADCTCRKPRPGMLLEAAARHDLDLERSFSIGDSLRDLQAARAVHATPVLVRTGKGAAQEPEARAQIPDLAVADGFEAATRIILAETSFAER